VTFVNAAAFDRLHDPIMMEPTERLAKCREHAVECRARANSTPFAAGRAAFLDLAEEWEAIAEEIEQIKTMRAFAAGAGHWSMAVGSDGRPNGDGSRGA
jgi:hypothetical protein